MAREEGTD